MKKQVEDWISFADKDLFAAEIILKDEYPLTNIIAFHCQQAIEKYLKAYLIEKNIPLMKIPRSKLRGIFVGEEIYYTGGGPYLGNENISLHA